MFHDDKLRRQLEEAFRQMNEPEEDKDKNNQDDDTQDTQSEDGGGDGGGDGGADGSVTTPTTSDTSSDSDNNDQRGIGGYGYYGVGRGWCRNGWNKDGSCKKNESYDNLIDSTQELYAIYEGMELIEKQQLDELDIPDGVTPREWANARNKYGFEIPRDDLVQKIIQSRDKNNDAPSNIADVYEQGGTSARYAASDGIVAEPNDAENDLKEGKKNKKSKTQPHELGYSGDARSGNKHMPPPSQQHGKRGKDKIRDDRRKRKQQKHDIEEAKDKRKDDPCWKNYKQVGNKTKNGKEVPNCVPVKKENKESIKRELGEARIEFKRLARIINEHHLNDEIRGVWDAFDQLAQRIANLEKSYEQEYEKMAHPQMAAETKKAHQNPEGGLNDAGRAAAKKKGHNLKRPVSKDQAKKSPKAAERRDSFCKRMKGMKKKNTSSKTANDPDSRINKSLRKWDCN